MAFTLAAKSPLWMAFVAALTAKGIGLGFDAPTIAAGIAIGIGSLLLVGGLILRFSKQS
jgi:hypothetical protein